MSEDLFAAMKPGSDATVTMPDGSTITGQLIESSWHQPVGDAIYCDFKILTEGGHIISASMTHKDFVAGTPPKAKEMSYSPPYVGVDFGSKTAYPIKGLKSAEATFNMELSPEAAAAFTESFEEGDPTNGTTPTPDLSQIVADLQALQAKPPQPKPYLKPALDSIAAKMSPSAFAEKVLDQMKLNPYQSDIVDAMLFATPEKKALTEKVAYLVMQIGKELQKASPDELAELMKNPVYGLNIPIVPSLSPLALVKVDDIPSEKNTIKVLHVKLEVSE